jgi:SpoVK/Ycf46/Vps4 family AAA+-type ATPase
MPRKSTKYLTYYASPADASPRDRLIARLACRLMLSVGRRRDLYEELAGIGRLLAWSRPVLLRLSRHARRRSQNTNCAQAGCREPLSKLVIGNNDDDEPTTAGTLLDPEDWPNMSKWFSELLDWPTPTRKRLLLDSLAWIDSAKQSEQWSLRKNIGFLAESLQLSEAEQVIVGLVAAARESELLRNLLVSIKAETLQLAAEPLASVLETTVESVRCALRSSGTLACLGLIGSAEALTDLQDLIQARNARLYDALQQSHDDVHSFLNSFLKPAPSARIERGDVLHLASFLDLAMRLVRNGLNRHEPGINVLLHGAPGTGKTEFARLLARELGARLYEIDGDDGTGSSADSKERLAALILASRALQGRDDAVLLFDEAEDAFPSSHGWLFNTGGINKPRYAKAWMNRLLETLPVPVIWISNSIDSMDPAYLRRFALHVRFRELPGSVKRRLADQYLGGTAVGENLKQEIARLPALTPGQLETAARVVQLCHTEGPAQAEQVVRLQLRAHREAIGLDFQRGSLDPAIPYQSGFLNLREPMNVPALLSGLRNHPRAALCFYGVPGTGKTQLAHYLADQLGRELIYKSASDLLSKWVGETERLIAELFSEAEDRLDDVMILLDEADTFLRDRARAHASWELSQTNEFLARMERFPGLFICTTNLMDTLDPAILRRFQFRVEFLPMRCEQSIEAFAIVFGRSPGADEREQLRELSGLVPADFANVVRQLKFFEGKENANPTRLLRQELESRRGSIPRSIGFIPKNVESTGRH